VSVSSPTPSPMDVAEQLKNTSFSALHDIATEKFSGLLMDPLYESLISLRRILRIADIQAKKLAKDSGLTTSKLLVLQTIDEQGEVTIGKIAEAVNLTQATITTIIDSLQNAGYVQRERSTSDKRKVFVTLTEDGRETLVAAPTALHQRFSEGFEELEDWEQMQIAAVLKRLSTILGAERIDAAPVLDIGMIDRNP